MKYPNIKAAHLSHAQIASAFKYKSVNSFRGSTAHKTMMRGVETILDIQNKCQELKVKRAKQAIAIMEAVKVVADSMTDKKRQWLEERGFHQR